MTFKNQAILDHPTPPTGKVKGVPARSSSVLVEPRCNMPSFRSPARMALWVCEALIFFGIGQNAMAVLTNYLNRPIMACGGEHALMLKSDGTVWVWGNDSHSQQFGGAVSPYLGNDNFDWNPSRVPGILGGVAVAAGSFHSLVLKWDGTVVGFGENS